MSCVETTSAGGIRSAPAPLTTMSASDMNDHDQTDTSLITSSPISLTAAAIGSIESNSSRCSSPNSPVPFDQNDDEEEEEEEEEEEMNFQNQNDRDDDEDDEEDPEEEGEDLEDEMHSQFLPKYNDDLIQENEMDEDAINENDDEADEEEEEDDQEEDDEDYEIPLPDTCVNLTINKSLLNDKSIAADKSEQPNFVKPKMISSSNPLTKRRSSSSSIVHHLNNNNPDQINLNKSEHSMLDLSDPIKMNPNVKSSIDYTPFHNSSASNHNNQASLKQPQQQPIVRSVNKSRRIRSRFSNKPNAMLAPTKNKSSNSLLHDLQQIDWLSNLSNPIELVQLLLEYRQVLLDCLTKSFLFNADNTEVNNNIESNYANNDKSIILPIKCQCGFTSDLSKQITLSSTYVHQLELKYRALMETAKNDPNRYTPKRPWFISSMATIPSQLSSLSSNKSVSIFEKKKKSRSSRIPINSFAIQDNKPFKLFSGNSSINSSLNDEEDDDGDVIGGGGPDDREEIDYSDYEDGQDEIKNLSLNNLAKINNPNHNQFNNYSIDNNGNMIDFANQNAKINTNSNKTILEGYLESMKNIHTRDDVSDNETPLVPPISKNNFYQQKHQQYGPPSSMPHENDGFGSNEDDCHRGLMF